jgi:hypothetical protein
MDGRTIVVPLVWYPRLLNATAAQRANWEIGGAGFGIHWPDVDEDLETPGLLAGAPSPEFVRAQRKKQGENGKGKSKSSNGKPSALKDALIKIMRERRQPLSPEQIAEELEKEGYKISTRKLTKGADTKTRPRSTRRPKSPRKIGR